MAAEEVLEKSRPYRWLAAGLILAFGVLGGLLHWFETCEQTTVASGQVVTTCRDPSVTDASVVFAGVLFLMLIAPDFEEAGLFGFSLKRRVQQQGEKQQALEGQLNVVAARVETVAAATAVANTNVYVLTEGRLEEARRSVEAKRPEYLRLVQAQTEAAEAKEGGAPEQVTPEGEGAPEEPGAREVAPATEAATLQTDILAIWEELARLLHISPWAIPAGSIAVESTNEAVRRQQFATLFSDELQAVQAARNLVAHAQLVSDDILREAVDVGNELLRIGRASLR